MNLGVALKRGMLVFFGLTFGLVVLEILVRATLPEPAHVELESGTSIEDTADDSPINLSLTKSINTAPNPLYQITERGIRLRPNTHVVVEGHETCRCRAEIFTNSYGFRGPEPDINGAPRVLFLGDSITLADYIPEEQTWVREVEKMGRNSGVSFQAINAGTWAVGLADELALLVDRGLLLDPKLVVLGFYLNDLQSSPGFIHRSTLIPAKLSWSAYYVERAIDRMFGFGVSQRYSVINSKDLDLWKKRAAVKFLDNLPKQNTEAKDFYSKTQDFFFDWGAAFSEDTWNYLLPYFQELKRLAGERGFKVAVIAFPVIDQVKSREIFNYPQERLKGITRELEFPYLDLLPALRTLEEEFPGEIYYDWCHPTPLGNSKVAGKVYEFLEPIIRRLDK